ncbi:hypothetical protein HDV02_002694 [Globomyces sp. JEL0801]|nr:hypothetical protein HDV02_002694 [Globomyces sp. JEL0801]
MSYLPVNERGTTNNDIELKQMKIPDSDANTLMGEEDEEHLLDPESEHAWSKSVAPNTDDPSTPAFTFRVLFLGILWASFLAVANTVFSFRKNPFGIPSTIVVLLAYPMGLFMEVTLPKGILNPGPFNVKEHVLIVMLAAAAGDDPYGADNVVGQYADQFLNDKNVNYLNSILWIVSSQMVGFGLAGVCRRFLVKPVTMIWPTVLPDIALYTSFHEAETAGDSSKHRMSRFTFFWLVFGIVFLYHWLPGYFTPAIGLVSLLCLFSSNRTLRLLGSGDAFEGPGILTLSFDWSVFAMMGPLTSPFWASINIFVQSVFWGWIVVPLVHSTNFFNTPKLQGPYGWDGKNNTEDSFPPINSNAIYDKSGAEVKPLSFVFFPSMKLDESKYQAHAPFYLSATFAVSYFCSFLNIASVCSHVWLWYGSTIYRQAKEAFSYAKVKKLTDLHNNLMSSYRDIPDWIYLAYFGVFVVIQVLVCEFTPFRMPIWATLLAVGLGSILTIPIGIIQAITGVQMGLNVLTEFLIGLLIPGDTVAVMTFKSLGFNVMMQALSLIRDLKISHYMHISPIAMVASQLIGTLIGAVLNATTLFWCLRVFKEELLEFGGEWSATTYSTFVNAGAIWGSIGPLRFFGPGSPYYILLLGFPIGFALPFIPWLCNRIRPAKFWKLINIPLLTLGVAPGRNQAMVVMPFLISCIFNFLIYRRYRSWWDKYNFILSCGLDSGVAVSVLMIVYWRMVGEGEGLGFSPLNPNEARVSADYYCLGSSFS